MFKIITVRNTLNIFSLKFFKRQRSVWLSNQVVKSPFKEVKVPEISLVEHVWASLEKWPEKTAVVCGLTGRSIKYEKLHKLSRTFAVSLRVKFNLQDGDVVCVMLPNVPEYPVATLGIFQAGCVVTTINPIYTAYEVQRQMELSNAKIVVTSPTCINTVKEAIAKTKKIIPIVVVRAFGEDLPPDTICFSELSERNHVDFSILSNIKLNANDVCLLPYSSGTTGLPKGVELTNRNLVANCEQLCGNEIRHYNDNTGSNQDTVLQVLPAYHIYGFTTVMMHKLLVGSKLVMLPAFQPKTFIDALVKYKVNLFYAVPPIVLFMGSTPDLKAKQLEHLKLVVSAAAPLPLSDVHALLDKSQNNLNFIQAYGLTETSPLATCMVKDEFNPTSVGYALPNTELKVVDENNNSLGPDQVGELYIRGPQVMRGYRNNEEATKNCMTEDGWFKSGDSALMNDKGAVKIADRLKELIKVKGFQVPPAELENVLREHPNVHDAAVIGISHEKFGEIPKAFVVRKNDKIEDKEIMSFVSERVAPYKKIHEIEFVDELPKTASGKILRRLLKENHS